MSRPFAALAARVKARWSPDTHLVYEATSDDFDWQSIAQRDASDPDLCSCGHEGMGWGWHLRPCPIKEAHR